MSNRVILLDADLNSADSVQHLIDAGLVEYFMCNTFPQFLEHKERMRSTLKEGDVVVIDTITSLLDLCRMNAKLGTERDSSDWDKRNLYIGGDKGFLAVYNYATDVTLAHIADFRATGASIVMLAHEDQERDPLTLVNKRGPKANPAAVEAIIRKSSDVMRLTIQQENERNAEGKVTIPEGTRILHLRNTEETIAKIHVRRDLDGKVPGRLKDPTMAKIREKLQKTPSWLTVYGSAGAGKTTLATSDAQDTYITLHPTKENVKK